MNTKLDIAKLYIAMFDRAPEKTGLDYWYKEVEAGKSLSQIANEMASAAKKYPNMYPQYANYNPDDADSVKTVINKVYKILFNKDDTTDAKGVNYWVDQIVKEHKDLGTVIVTLEKAAEEYLNSDNAAAKAAAETFENRTDAAIKVSNIIPSADVNGDGKIDSTDFSTFQNIITKVTAKQSTIDTAVKLADDYAPKNFDLTDGVDKLVGTDGPNVFDGVISSLSSEATLNSGDKIDGKGGVDTFNINMKGNFSGIGSDGYIKNIENINLTNDNTLNRTFDATNVSGVEKYTLTGSESGNSINLSNVNQKDIEVDLKNMNKDVSISFDSNLDLSGNNDTMTIGLDGVGKADTTPDDENDDTTYTKLTMDKIEDITLNTSEKSSYVDLSGLTEATSITVKGNQDLTIGSTNNNGGVPTNLKTFDASQNKGTIKADFSNATNGTLSTIKTGDSEDTVKVKTSTINAEPTIDLGNGDDTLKLDVASDSTIQPNMSGVETLELTNLGGNLIFSNLKTNGLEKVVFDANNGAGNTATFANMGNMDIKFDVTNNGSSALNNKNSTVQLDNSGNTTINISDPKATTSSLGKDNTNVTLTEAQAATINVSPSITETGTYTFDKATNVTINVDDKLNSSGTPSTSFNAKVVASKATDVTIDAKGTATLAKNSDLSEAQNVTLKAENKTSNIDLDTNNVALSAAHMVNMSGDGQIKLDNVGLKGTTPVDYNVDVTATGLGQGLTLSNIASKQDVTLDISKVTGTITENTGSEISGANVTIAANGLGKDVTIGNINAFNKENGTADLNFENDLNNVTIGNIGENSQFDTVKVNVNNDGKTVNIGTINADNKVDMNGVNALGDVTIGKIANNATSTTEGKKGVGNVTIDLSSSLGTNTIGDDNTGYTNPSSSDVLVRNNLIYKSGINAANKTNGLNIGIDNDGKHNFTADLTGNIGNDVFTFNTVNDAKSNVVLKGDLGSGQTGTDVSVNVSSITTNTNQSTIDISSLEHYNASSIIGGAGNDTITGGTGNDTIDGGAGNDTITGGTGNDTIDGGAGNDTITGGTGNDTIDGGAGNDTMNGGDGSDTYIIGSNFNADKDQIKDSGTGNSDTDTIEFTSTADFSNVTSNGTNKKIHTNMGIENIKIGNVTATVDAAQISGESLKIAATTNGQGILTVKGNTTTADTIDLSNLTFDNANNISTVNIIGGNGNDTIKASSHGDVIDGGTGTDSITLGSGKDTVILSSPFENADKIKDFKQAGNDKIAIDLKEGGKGAGVSNPNLVKTKAFKTNKLLLITHSDKNAGIVSKGSAALFTKSSKTIGNGFALTSKMSFKAKSKTALANYINNTLTFGTKENASGVVVGHNSANTKLYLFVLTDTNGTGTKGANGQHIVTTKTIATFTNPASLTAGDIVIF